MADEQLITDIAERLDSHVDTTAELRTLIGGYIGKHEVEKLDEPVLHALGSVAIERMMLGRAMGLSSFRGARDLFDVLGYNELLQYREYRGRYRRGGLAKRVIDAYPVAVWRAGAEVYEDEDATVDTEFEKAWKSLESRLGVWSRLQRAHILALLSTYSVLLIGAKGTGDLSTELPRGSSPDQVLYLKPYSGGGGPATGNLQDQRARAMDATCSIREFDIDPNSPRYGEAAFYQFKRAPNASTQLDSAIHWSRIIHVADELLDDDVYGTPALEAVWNLFDDLYKVTGGGSEAFWLRAKNAMHVDFDKTMGLPGKPGAQLSAQLTPEQRKSFEEKAEKLQHQIDSVMVTKGATITQLSSATANIKDPADAIITQIAGTKAIPKRILVGSEMGQLASGQDKDNWNTAVQDKRTNWAFPGLVKPLAQRLLDYGYLPPLKTKNTFFVEWPIIEDLTEDEKAKYALDLANVNKSYGSTVFTEDEIRDKCYRMEPGKDEVDDPFRAELAVKLTMANKQMGVTVFTDDEIRKLCYGWEPLAPDQKVPIGAPERISVAEPPPEGGPDDTPAPGTEEDIANKAKAAPLAAQLAALEAAIEESDMDAIAKIIGVTA
jgi:hypothetical protein